MKFICVLRLPVTPCAFTVSFVRCTRQALSCCLTVNPVPELMKLQANFHLFAFIFSCLVLPLTRKKIVKPQMTGLSLTPGLSIFPKTSVKLSMLDRDLQGVKLDSRNLRENFNFSENFSDYHFFEMLKDSYNNYRFHV